MTRRTEVIKLDEGWLVKAWAKTEAEASAIQFAAIGVPNPGAFMPKLGEPFDPPEEPRWPSDANATWYPPPCDGNNAHAVSAENSAGAVLAQAQHEAAVDGEDCTSGACLLTRGSD